MELREFIKEAIVQIVDGVKDAQGAVLEKGAKVSAKPKEQDVVFNVSLAEVEDRGGKIGVGVALYPFKGEATKGKSQKGEAVTEVSFIVPLTLPDLGESQFDVTVSKRM